MDGSLLSLSLSTSVHHYIALGCLQQNVDEYQIRERESESRQTRACLSPSLALSLFLSFALHVNDSSGGLPPRSARPLPLCLLLC